MNIEGLINSPVAITMVLVLLLVVTKQAQVLFEDTQRTYLEYKTWRIGLNNKMPLRWYVEVTLNLLSSIIIIGTLLLVASIVVTGVLS